MREHFIYSSMCSRVVNVRGGGRATKAQGTSSGRSASIFLAARFSMSMMPEPWGGVDVVGCCAAGRGETAHTC